MIILTNTKTSTIKYLNTTQGALNYIKSGRKHLNLLAKTTLIPP